MCTFGRVSYGDSSRDAEGQRWRWRWLLWVGSGPSPKSRVVYADGKRHALEQLEAWQSEMGDAVTLKRYSVTVAEEARGWIAARSTLATNTRPNYKLALDEGDKHPTARIPLSKVTPADLKKMVDSVAVVSLDYARRLRTILHQPLKVAAVEGKIAKLPIAPYRPALNP